MAKSHKAAILSSLHQANAVQNSSAHGFAALIIENQSLQSMLTIWIVDDYFQLGAIHSKHRAVDPPNLVFGD